MAVLLTILIFAGCAYIAYKITIAPERERNARNDKGLELERYVSCNHGLFNVLELKKRSSALIGAFKVEASRDVNVSYTPDKLVYTGATVGGITTGGFHVEKGGYSMSTGAKTGNYFLSYKYGNQYGSYSPTYVHSIKMNDADYKYAIKNFPLLQPDKDKKNVLIVRGGKESLEKLMNWMCQDS